MNDFPDDGQPGHAAQPNPLDDGAWGDAARRRVLFDESSLPQLLLDGHECIVEVNRALSDYVELPRGELLGRPLDALVLPRLAAVAPEVDAAGEADSDPRVCAVVSRGRVRFALVVGMPGASAPAGLHAAAARTPRAVALVDVTRWVMRGRRKRDHALAQRDAIARKVHHHMQGGLQAAIATAEAHVSNETADARAIAQLMRRLRAIGQMPGLQARLAPGPVTVNALVGQVVANLSAVHDLPLSVAERFEGAPAPMLLAEPYRTPVALIVAELVTIAIKHAGPVRMVKVVVCTSRDHVLVRVTNGVADGLRAALDRPGDANAGLALVRSMMPCVGVALEFAQSASRVHARLLLTAPAV